MERLGAVRRLVSMALFDPDGVVAPFVRDRIVDLAQGSTTLVATATHPLAKEDAAFVRRYGQLIERDNVGLDMAGHRLVLARHDPKRFDEVIITNDTFAALEPLARITDRIDPAADFWGITASRELGEHVQSYFVAFRESAVHSPAFAAHWAADVPEGRRRIIVAGEVGLSRTLRRAGLRFDVAFHPSAAQAMRAQLRAWRHPMAGPRGVVGQWNPTMVLPDAALEGSLPVVKMSTLRFDPYQLGRERLLDALVARYPEQLASVREYLERTDRAYT